MAEEVEVEVETVSSPSDGEEVIQVDDPFSMRRQELKDLRTQLLIHRKAAKSGDKKRKKAVQEEIAAIEALLESKRLALESDMKQAAGAALVMERTRESELVAQAKAKRLAKRVAKSQGEAEQRKEAEMLAAEMPQRARMERESFSKLFAPINLAIHDIEPDGNCLFNALAHQLRLRHNQEYTGQQLRMLAVEYISLNAEKYIGFLDEEESVSEYCERLAKDMWGGHLELDALVEVLTVPIIVYQADAEPIRFGERISNGRPPLCIAFQKYAYSLGEHFDSLVDTPVDDSLL